MLVGDVRGIPPSARLDSLQLLDHPDQAWEVQGVTVAKLLPACLSNDDRKGIRPDMVLSDGDGGLSLAVNVPLDSQVLHRSRVNVGQCRAVFKHQLQPEAVKFDEFLSNQASVVSRSIRASRSLHNFHQHYTGNGSIGHHFYDDRPANGH